MRLAICLTRTRTSDRSSAQTSALIILCRCNFLTEPDDKVGSQDQVISDRERPADCAGARCVAREGKCKECNVLAHAQATSGRTRSSPRPVRRAPTCTASPPRGIDCDLALTGRFTITAATPNFERLARKAETLAAAGVDAYAVLRERQRDHLGTNLYRGGACAWTSAVSFGRAPCRHVARRPRLRGRLRARLRYRRRGLVV